MTTSPSHDSYKYNDQAKLNALTATAVQYIDKVYEYLDTETDISGGCWEWFYENYQNYHDLGHPSFIQDLNIIPVSVTQIR